jgi:hypothetical protein
VISFDTLDQDERQLLFDNLVRLVGDLQLQPLSIHRLPFEPKRVNRFASFVHQYEHLPTLSYLQQFLHNTTSLPSTFANNLFGNYKQSKSNRKGRSRNLFGKRMLDNSKRDQSNDNGVYDQDDNRQNYYDNNRYDNHPNSQETSQLTDGLVCDEQSGNCYFPDISDAQNQYVALLYQDTENQDYDYNNYNYPQNLPSSHSDVGPAQLNESQTEVDMPSLPVVLDEIISFVKLAELFLKKKVTFRIASDLFKFVVRYLIPLIIRFKVAAFKCFMLAIPLDLLLVPLGIITGINPLLMPFAPLAMIIIGMSKLFASTICFLLAI